MQFTNATLELAEEIPVFGKGIAVIAKTSRLALESANINSEGDSAEDPFSDRVNDLYKELGNRLAIAHSTMTTQLPNLIAADYGKLKRAGECTDPTSTCSAEWRTSASALAGAAGALDGALQREFYGALMPAKWNVYKLPVANRSDQQNFQCESAPGYNDPFDPMHPFSSLPAGSLIHRPLKQDDPGHADLWQVRGMGLARQVDFQGRAEMLTPGTEVTDRLYLPLDPGGNLTKGGLGVDKGWFMARYWRDGTPLPRPNSVFSECT